MTRAQFKLAEAASAATILVPLFVLMHLIEGLPPAVSEFEAGAITAVVLLRLIEAAHAHFN